MLLSIKIIIGLLVWVVTYVAYVQFRDWRRHCETKYVTPAPGQIWCEFGCLMRITMVDSFGMVYIENISGEERWKENKVEWKKKVERNQRYLKRDVEVTDDTANR